jgi:PilZ domain
VTANTGLGPKGLERRRGVRTPVELAVPISVVGARLVNISPFGMMIESPVALERESILSFRLVIGDHKGDIEARVAACTLGASGQAKRYGIGLEFTSIPLDIHSRLRKALGPIPESARTA